MQGVLLLRAAVLMSGIKSQHAGGIAAAGSCFDVGHIESACRGCCCCGQLFRCRAYRVSMQGVLLLRAAVLMSGI